MIGQLFIYNNMGKEYDRDMLKKNIDRFNAILENGYVQNCLNVLD